MYNFTLLLCGVHNVNARYTTSKGCNAEVPLGEMVRLLNSLVYLVSVCSHNISSLRLSCGRSTDLSASLLLMQKVQFPSA